MFALCLDDNTQALRAAILNQECTKYGIKHTDFK